MNEELCGYDTENLALFAAACKKAGVTENDLLNFAKNAQEAYTFGINEFESALMRRLESDFLFGSEGGAE